MLFSITTFLFFDSLTKILEHEAVTFRDINSKVNGNHEITTQKQKEVIFSPHQD